MTTDKSDTKKRTLLEALERSLGVVTTACKQANIARSTYYEWMQKDNAFRREVEDIQEIAIDFAESQLHKQIRGGNTSATIFYLKTKGRTRGYQEHQSITFEEPPTTFSWFDD
jgi:replication-associated recombination protein RarA